MMKSRELVYNLLTKGDADRIGLYEHFWPETTDFWAKQGYPTRTVYENGLEKVLPEDPYTLFPFDLHPAGGWFDVYPLRGHDETVEESDEWIVKRNGAGGALKTWKHKSGTPEHVDFRMANRDIWERDYRSYLLRVDPKRLSIKENKASLAQGRLANKWAFFGHMFTWETARQSLGDYVLYQSLLTDPGWIHDYNRVYTDFFKAHFRLLFQEVGMPDGIWVFEDLGYRGHLFASPKTLRSLIFPYFAELVEFFHSFGLPVVLHSCGNVTQAVPLVIEAGFDALNPMEAKSGCDVLALAKQYGDKLAFVGGLDARILESNDRDTIQRGVSDLLNTMKTLGARYVFGTDHSVSPLVHYDSYRYALDIYNKHMMY